jgi:RNA polymerase sigma-70 factor (ECF subfamily)
MASSEIVTLAAKAAGGNKKAFEELCRCKTQEILFSSLVILGNMSDAEDATQEIILDMYRHIGKLREPKAVNAWIQRIVRCKCVDLIRSQGKPVDVELSDVDDETVSAEIADDDKDFLPEAYAEDREMGELLYGIVTGLPVKRREVILMYYYEDMSYKEIALATGVSINTVATNLKRARDMIKEALDKEARRGTPGRSHSPGFDQRSLETKTKERRRTGMAIMGTGVTSADASATVLGRIMRQQADSHVPSEAVHAAESRWMDAIHRSHFPAARAKALQVAVSAILSFIVAAAVLSPVIFGDAGDGAPEAPGVESSPAAGVMEGGRAITFSGGVCDCGHLNPDDASLVLLRGGDSVDGWVVRDNSGGAALFRGGGAEPVSRAIGEMKAAGMTGDYTVEFHVTGKGGVAKVTRRFSLEPDVGG